MIEYVLNNHPNVALFSIQVAVASLFDRRVTDLWVLSLYLAHKHTVGRLR